MESVIADMSGRPAYTESAVVFSELRLVVMAWVTTATAGAMAAAVVAAGTGTIARLALACVFLPLCHRHDVFIATDMQQEIGYVNSWARRLQQHKLQEGWFGSRRTELHGYKGEQEVLSVNLLLKAVPYSIPYLPLLKCTGR